MDQKPYFVFFSPLSPLRVQPTVKYHPRWQPIQELAVHYRLGRFKPRAGGGFTVWWYYQWATITPVDFLAESGLAKGTHVDFWWIYNFGFKFTKKIYFLCIQHILSINTDSIRHTFKYMKRLNPRILSIRTDSFCLLVNAPKYLRTIFFPDFNQRHYIKRQCNTMWMTTF